jgi:hypothetical protein
LEFSRQDHHWLVPANSPVGIEPYSWYLSIDVGCGKSCLHRRSEEGTHRGAFHWYAKRLWSPGARIAVWQVGTNIAPLIPTLG